jgi:hypothetical protein
MLFSPFTWTQFFVTVITLTSLYYCCVLLLLYRAALAGFLKRIFRAAIPVLSASAKSSLDDPMGEVTSESEFSLSDPSTMDFSDEGQERSIDDNQASTTPSLEAEKHDCPAGGFAEIADFTEELKILFHALKESGGNENLFNMLFSSLLERYPGIKTSTSRKALDASILQMSTEIPTLKLSKEKLDQLWGKYPA